MDRLFYWIVFDRFINRIWDLYSIGLWLFECFALTKSATYFIIFVSFTLLWFAYYQQYYPLSIFLYNRCIFIVYCFLYASRSPILAPISLFLYPLHYYGLLIINSITPGTIYWTIGGLSIVSVFSLPFLIHRRKQRSGLFWTFIILSIMLIFPIF